MHARRTPGTLLGIILSSLVALFVATACGGARSSVLEPDEPRPDPPLPPLPWRAGYVPDDLTTPSPFVALAGGTVMTATGEVIERGVVVMRDGRIRAVGRAGELDVPDGADVIDTTGRFVTPGLIDTHSHMGVYAVPDLGATSDGNESTAPVTAQVWAGDSFWPQDPALPRALASGVTTIQVLPGSANLIGGRGVVVKLHLGRSIQEMRFPGAPDTLKMACGENPKRVYGGRDTAPSTRMGNVAGYRAAFQQAREYRRSWLDWQQNHRLWEVKRILYDREMEEIEREERERARRGGHRARQDEHDDGEDDDEEEEEDPEDPGPPPAPPARDFGLEALVGAIEGRVLVQMHCYRADEMARMIQIADEFSFHIRSFHHAVEAYKVRDLLHQHGIAVSTWADWWGFKLEAFDAIPENLALLTESRVRAVLHSDSAMLVQRLSQEAAKAMAAGRRAGIEITEDQALAWITKNAAWVLGIERYTGTIEAGKMADVVVWSGSPFSVYTRADLVFLDGRLAYDRTRPQPFEGTDFEAGLAPEALP